MHRRVLALGLFVAAISIAVPAPASAELLSTPSIVPSFAPGHGGYQHEIRLGGWLRRQFGGGKKSSGSPNHVPELDPAGVGSAAILLLGGSLVLLDRRRRARKGSSPAS